MSQVKAIHFKEGGGKAADTLELTSISKPTPGSHDLLVKLKACAINPIDTKVRQGAFPAADITGFDAAGIVEAVGSEVKNFKVNDEVYYAGTLGRPGSTAQYNLVDARIAALKPKKLDWVDASCVPLVTITAWEMLEEQFNLVQDDVHKKQASKSILIINGAGGVGTAATQLAAKVFKLGKVIVTASRPETKEHAEKMGATHVISHREDIEEQLKKAGIEKVDYIFICYDTTSYMPTAVKIAAPSAKIGSIVEINDKLPGMENPDAFMKRLSFHWEIMFSKSVLQYDMESQGDILRRVAELYDSGVLKTLLSESNVLSVKSLVEAHDKLESGKAIGKIGLEIKDDIN